MKRKSAFTLTETLIMAAIVGVIAIIAISSLRNLRPDKDAVLVRKVYNEISTVVYSLANDEEIYPAATRTAMLPENWLASIMQTTLAKLEYKLYVYPKIGLITPNQLKADQYTSGDDYMIDDLNSVENLVCYNRKTLALTTCDYCISNNQESNKDCVQMAKMAPYECTARRGRGDDGTMSCEECIASHGSEYCYYDSEATNMGTSSSNSSDDVKPDEEEKPTSSSGSSPSSSSGSSSGGMSSDYCKTNAYEQAAICSMCGLITGGCGETLCVDQNNTAISCNACASSASQTRASSSGTGREDSNNLSDQVHNSKLCRPFVQDDCGKILTCYSGEEPMSSMISSGDNSSNVTSSGFWGDLLSDLENKITSGTVPTSSDVDPFGTAGTAGEYATPQLSAGAKSAIFTDRNLYNINVNGVTSNNKFAYSFAQKFDQKSDLNCTTNACTFKTKDGMNWTVTDNFGNSTDPHALVMVDINGNGNGSDSSTGNKPDRFTFKIGAGGAISIYVPSGGEDSSTAKARSALSKRDPKVKD